MNYTVNTICVCGAGTMGSGIALCAAQHGFYTILFDVHSSAVENAKKAIEKNVQQLIAKNKIKASEADQILGRLQFTSDLNNCIADLIIEAIVEKAAVKISLFNQLAEINHSETIFATNTSSLSVTDIANGVMHPERVAGMHFFNPATIMKLVEVVKTRHSLEAVLETIKEVSIQMGKTPVSCTDAPGFIVNRVARPYYIEALRLAESGVPLKNIDDLLEASGFKMGPFKLMDLIGNDINYAVSCSVFEQLQAPARLKPSYIQEEKVKTGQLGLKTGKGYYEYPAKT